jgi:peptide/nickel transport system permease protein
MNPLLDNWKLGTGVALLAALIGLPLLGLVLLDSDLAFPLSAPIAAAPSWNYPFGTDASGRDLLAVIMVGTLLTMKIGVIAGVLGVAIGTALAFLAAYYGGWVDRIICLTVDVLLSVPGLLVLILIASSVPGGLSTTTMALVIAGLAWREPTRQIRAQALMMREANYVLLARLSGQRDMAIIFKEMIPNLLPYLGACLVAAVSGAILSSVGLEALGLGARGEPSIGMTIYWMMLEGAFARGMWWWVFAPVTILILLFISLYMLAVGLDEFSNPRLRSIS